jgi:hypothetical protein
MFCTTLQQVLTRMPDYTIVESQVERYPSVGIACGFIKMPATYSPSARIGSGLITERTGG